MVEIEQPPAAPAPKRGGKLLLIGLLIVFAAANAAIVAKVFVLRKPAAKAGTEAEVGAKVTLEEFLANLAGSGDHYIKTTVALGLKKGLTEQAIQEDIAPVRDVILSVLSRKRMEDLSTPAGKDGLKEEMVEAINRELGSKKVVRIYFTAFAMQ